MADVLAAIFLLVTTTTLAPGDALELTPGPPPPRVAQVPVGGSPVRSEGIPPIRLGALAASLAALVQWTRRRVDDIADLPITAPAGIRIVFVPGHGSSATGTFDEMMERLGLGGDIGGLEVVEYDYRLVEPWDSHRKAAQKATAEEVADGLASLLDAMRRADGGPIYLVGHSKGAGAIAELLARWDLHPDLAPDAVVGAALLDPPMSAGGIGVLQGVGRGPLAFIPNDGGYNPRHCNAVLFDCHDTRAHLGEATGIEVVVFRNPGSSLANFNDHPEELRVNTVRDPQASGFGIGAIADAHTYPLHSAAVAACIADEMRAQGSCLWPIRRWLTGEGG